MVSATHFIATHSPEARDRAMPLRPYSSTSATSAGSSSGISRSRNACSVVLVTVDDFADGSSPASTSTPPRGAVPIWLACRSTSPLRSTPGPLPYQMAKTPSRFAPG